MLLSLAGAALAGYAIVIAGLYVSQRRLLFRPMRSRPDPSALVRLGLREVHTETADGLSLLVWFLPPPRPGGPVILYFHGNGGHIGHRASRLAYFAAAGYGVMMPEYRGFGGNPGTPSEAGWYCDAEAALAFLCQQGVTGEHLAVYGESLGTAVATRFAARHQIAALVLESPFTSVAALAQCHYPYVPAAFLVRDRFDSAAVIADVKAPLLMLQGGRDRIVPPRFGQALFEAAPEPKEQWFAPDAGHENLAEFGALDIAIKFLRAQIGR